MVARNRAFALFLFLLLALAGQAVACPEEVGTNRSGYCLPICDRCGSPATPDLEFAGTALERAINFSHDQAVSGAQPIPPYIRQQLTGYVDPKLMDIVRYRIGDPGTAGFALRLDISAITLVDIIVFKNPDEACCDAALWAHELFHVSQYRAWGTHAFAIQYVRDYRVIEDPAYAFQHAYRGWKKMPVGSRCSSTTSDGIAYGIVVE